MRTAIIGGGIAGLAAAYELEQGRADYILYESRARLGGTLATEIVNGAVFERGPDSFLTEKPAAVALCRELGLEADLIPSNDAARKTYIVVKNRMVALPDGLMFLIPTKLLATAFTPLFSVGTKIRMGLDLLRRPRRRGDEDESVASLVERHYGREAVDRLADPLLSGIYGGDSAALSARSVLPRLVELEAEYGSLTRGTLAMRRKMLAKVPQASPNGRSASKTTPPAPRPIFTTLRGGVQQLVDTLAAQLEPGAVRTSTPIGGIARSGAGWEVEAGGRRERYDAVIVATQAWAAGELLEPVDAALGVELRAIPYSSSITVNLMYDEAALGSALPEGFGFLVPASEGRAMLACTFVHRKFLGRTPAGKAILRAFLGGIRNEGLLDAPDEELVATVRRELAAILGVTANPEHAQVSRWRRAMAQYAVGHQGRTRRIAERVAALPGLKLAGNAYDGIGISDCIRLGRKAAQEVLAGRKDSEAARQRAGEAAVQVVG